MNTWITTTLIVLPMAAGLLLWLVPLPKTIVGSIATLVSLIEVGIWISSIRRFDFGSNDLQFEQRHTWFRDLGVSWHVGQFGFSLWLVGLTVICGAAASAYAWWAGRERARAYFGLLLFLTGSVVGVFTAQDLLVFYAFFEAMLIPLYVLIGFWGGAGRLGATVKFVVYGVQQGTFDLTELKASDNVWLFLGFAIAFAVKAPLWPFHGWLPDAYRESPAEVSGLLSGVISKVAAYGFLRIAIVQFPGPTHDLRVPILVLASIGLVYGSLLAFRAPDVRGVIAYSSLGQMGLITFGLFATNDLGFNGAVLQMVNHGLISMTMFLLAGMVERRTATGEFALLGGMGRGRPVLATVLMIVGMMALAVPLSSNFAGEFLILAGIFDQHWIWAAIGAGAIVLAAMYMLRLISAILHREPGAAVTDAALDLRGAELGILLPLVGLLIALSAWPAAITDRAAAAPVAESPVVAPPTTLEEAYHQLGFDDIPASCKTAVFTFVEGRGDPQAWGDKLQGYVAAHPDGGGTVTFPAVSGTVPCPDGGTVDVSLDPIEVPFPTFAENPNFGPSDFILLEVVASIPVDHTYRTAGS